jgi:hypothetical protein
MRVEITDPTEAPPPGAPLSGPKAELQTYREELMRLIDQEPGYAFQRLAGISARLAEIRAQLYRQNNRAADALRTREVDPLVDTLEFVFKALSRAQAVREMEFRLSAGGV